jgi:hypothetical protein
VRAVLSIIVIWGNGNQNTKHFRLEPTLYHKLYRLMKSELQTKIPSTANATFPFIIEASPEMA